MSVDASRLDARLNQRSGTLAEWNRRHAVLANRDYGLTTECNRTGADDSRSAVPINTDTVEVGHARRQPTRLPIRTKLPSRSYSNSVNAALETAPGSVPSEIIGLFDIQKASFISNSTICSGEKFSSSRA
jgi:hypothetical protein